MTARLRVKVQNLFLVALALKVASSFLGWYLQMPWSLGFTVPLIVMAAYILTGLKWRNREVSDEKFADSCYYLGFIFTITSIIFALFDLPDIGMKIQAIAVRFGAAMLSTVLGLAVRVYLVSFREELSDAMSGVQDTMIAASHVFREQMVMAVEKLRDFESQVDLAARTTVERVNLQTEKLVEDHARRLDGFYTELSDLQREGARVSTEEMRHAAGRLGAAVNRYTEQVTAHLQTLESRVDAFSVAVMDRLQKTTFPDDYFAKQLQQPLAQMRASAGEMSTELASTSGSVREAAGELAAGVRQLRLQAVGASKALESVQRLALQQDLLRDASAGQVDTLAAMTKVLARIESALAGAVATMGSTHESNQVLVDRIASLPAQTAAHQKPLVDALAGAAASLGEQVGAFETATSGIRTAADDLRGSAAAVQAASSALAASAGGNAQLLAGLEQAGQSLGSLIQEIAASKQEVAARSHELAAALTSAKAVSDGLAAWLGSQPAQAKIETSPLPAIAPAAYPPPPTALSTDALPSSRVS